MSLDVSGTTGTADAAPSPPPVVVPGGLTPFVTVASLIAAVRRRWRVCALTAAAGLITALALSLAFPPPYSATTTLLLRHPSQSDPTRAMATEAELAGTRTVAQAAIRRLGLRLSPREFLSQYGRTPLTADLLQIRMTGPTGGEAVRRARALAQSFLTFRRDEYRREARVAVQALERRIAALTRELVDVNNRIITFSDASTNQQNDAAVRGLGDLLTRRSVITDDLAELRQRIDDITRDTDSIVEKSRVVDPAHEDDRSVFRTLATNLTAGLVGGLSVGTGWVLVQEVVTDRVRRRDDVMAALQAPVVVSTGKVRGPMSIQRRRFRRHRARSDPDVAKVVAHLRRSLAHSGTSNGALVVVSVDSDAAAAVAVASAAVELVHEEKDVLLADISRRAPLAALFDVPRGRTSTLSFPDTSSKLTLRFPLSRPQGALEGPPSEGEGERRDYPDVVLVLATLDPAVGAPHLREWASTAVAVVTAFRSRVVTLVSTSQMLRAAGVELSSAVLVGADPRDESLGMAGSGAPQAW